MSADIIPFPISRARLPTGVVSIEAVLYDRYIEACATARLHPTDENKKRADDTWLAWKQASTFL